MTHGQRVSLRGVNARVRLFAPLVSLLIFLTSLALANTSFAQTAPEPFVSTDRKDYSPGDTVTITGVNFQPGEVVTITVQSPLRADRFVTSVADANGSFTNTDFSPDENDRQAFITIAATGDMSGPNLTAYAHFYDATPIGACPFTVDASIAASDPPSSLFKTIQEAVVALPNPILPNPGPCTVNIKAAAAGTTYGEAVSISNVNSGVSSGSISLTFASATKTITRTSGSFLTNGFTVGQTITTNNAANPGPFTITNVTATVITVAETLTNAGPASTIITTPVSSANEIIIQPHPTNIGPVIVTAPGAADAANTSSAFTLSNSQFLTITGLNISGSQRSAIRLVNTASFSITIEGNVIANNNDDGVANTDAVTIGSDSANIWVVNNLISNNGRYGVNATSGTGPSYVVNNTIVENFWGGVQRGANAKLNLVNNLIVGNGPHAGDTGNCSCGLGQESTGSTTTILLTNNMFYKNGNATSGLKDIGTPAGVLDATDSGNRTTTGVAFTSGSITAAFASGTNTITRSTGSNFVALGFSVGNTILTNNLSNPGPFTITAVTSTVITVAQPLTTVASAPGVIISDITFLAGCTFSDCTDSHAFDEIFVDTGANDFHLKTTSPVSPAIDAGVNSFLAPLVSVSVTATFASATKTITRSTGVSFITSGFLDGQTITTTNASNPGPFTITNVTGTAITVAENVTTVSPGVTTTIATVPIEWEVPGIDFEGTTRPQGTFVDIGWDEAQGAVATYTVTYDGNGSDGGTAPVDPNSYAAGATVTVLSAGTLTRTGYTFAGWNTAANGSGTSYSPPPTFAMPANNVTLYAQWTINQYTVTFNANGGTGSMSNQTRNYNDAANLTANAFTRTGYTFAGWNTVAGGGGTAYADQASYPFTASVTLYAQWTINQYTVTFNANGGTGSMSNQTRNYNDAANLTANAFTRTGYTFTGWNTAANGSGTPYANGANYDFTASITLYAQWTINQYTVTFNTNGGSGSMSNQTRNYNDAANLTANAFTRTGYTFTGWNTAANGSGTPYANGANYDFTASITLYAQWTINQYTVTFNANGGSGSMSNQTRNYNDAANLTANAFTRTGYTFAGWNTVAGGGGTAYADQASYPFTASVTLYAQWKGNTSLSYDGVFVAVIGNNVTLTATLSSIVVACKAGQTISFSLDDNPTTLAIDGPYSLGTAVTNASGVATLTVPTTGWLDGVYTVTVSYSGNTNCVGSSDDGGLTAAAPGDSATGGGWYTPNGRLNFGFTTRRIPNVTPVAYRGQILIHNNGKWRFKGSLDSYVLGTSGANAGVGTVGGTGNLYRWDSTANGGLGAWMLVGQGIGISASFKDLNQGGGKKNAPQDMFGAQINYNFSGSSPNSGLTELKGGNISIK